MSDTTRLQLPLIAAAQAQKHVTHNEAIMRLDGLVQMTAKSYTTSAQPGSPADGDLYLLPAGKTGTDWGGYSNYAVAHYYDGIWHQYHPNAGWISFVQDTGKLLYYTGSAWADIGATVSGLFGDGSVGAPAIGFASDTDNGLYRIGANNWAGAAGGVKGFELDASANFKVAKLLDISAAAAGQVKFPATQNPSADANTLDDYKEGTFTPALTFGGGSTGITYGTRFGAYTKLGRAVAFSLGLTLTSKGTSTGPASITGLPFAASVTGVGFPWAPGQNITFSGALNAYLPAANPSQLDLYAVPSGGVAAQLADTAFTNSSQLFVSGIYMS
ncbi:MAG: DUF2793 domain-containing protein [Alphaproteobacteria bacterium]